MRERQFVIKYRYQRQNDDLISGNKEDEENYQWYLIDISNQINEGIIKVLTFEDLIEQLKLDNAQFHENNIKLKHEVYWITIGENNFEMDFTSEDEDIDEEIILLLERQKCNNQEVQETDTVQKILQNMDRISGVVDKIQQRQNDFVRYFSLDMEDKFKDLLCESMSFQLDKQKDLLEESMNNLLNQYYLSLVSLIQSNKQLYLSTAESFKNANLQKSQNNQSQFLMDQSFSYKPQLQQLEKQPQMTFNFNLSDSQFNNTLEVSKNIAQDTSKNSLIFSSNFQHNNTEIGFNKQEKQEENIFNQLKSIHTAQVKSIVDQDMDSALKQKTRFFANILEEEETRNKELSITSDSILKTISHLDSKQNNNSSIFNQNGIQSKSGSLRIVNTSIIQNPEHQQIIDLEKKQSEKPQINSQMQTENIFKNNKYEDDSIKESQSLGPFLFNIPKEQNNEQEQAQDQNSQIPILFNIPQESNSPEIDFFKNVKSKKNDKLTSFQIISSELSGRADDIQNQQNLNNPKSTNKNTIQINSSNKNTPNPFQNNIGSKPKINFLLPDPFPQSQQQNNSLNSSIVSENLDNIFNFIGKKSHQAQSNNDQDVQIQTRKQVQRSGERKSSKHQKTLIDSKSTGYNLNSQKSKTANMTDMTILYSEPLVKQGQVVIQGAQPVLLPAGDPVDYELEIQKLNEFLKESNKQIKLDIVVASLDNLEKAFTRNTQILHIMCHGDYSEKEQQYYLTFEDEESKIDAITSKRFQEFLKKKNSNVKLIFFNACHSEEVGKIFQDSGIPFVIAVQSDLKIEDKAALTFSSSFYMNIFSGLSVLESFESARSSLQAKQHESCFTCCCAHSHDDNCLWFIEAMNNGFDQAHEQHKPKARCKCPNANKMFHKYQCEWAHEFLKKYKDNYDDYIEEALSSEQELFVCCCHTILTPHDESLKFRLIKNPAQEDCKIMVDLPEGNIVEKSNLDFNHPIFQDQTKIFGRNMEIYKIYKYFMSNNKLKTRFVGLNGQLGSGKTAVAKKVARHLKERSQVSEIIFEDFERMKTKITKFEQKMRLGYHSKEVAYSHIKDKKILFILDNCDDLIKNNKFKFETTLNELAQNTAAKFLILSHEKFDLKLGQGSTPQVTLGQLSEFYVKQLIEFYAGDAIRDYSNKPKFQDQLSELIRIMPKSPKSIMETVQNITENMDIQQILTQLKSNKISDKQKDFTAFNLLMKDLKQTNQQAYDMLLLISLFPHGVSVEDLKFLERKKKIPHDWIKIMESLTLYQNDNRAYGDQSFHELPETGLGLKRMQSKRPTIIQPKQEDDNLEEDDFDNDQQQEEIYRFKKFKNGQYFWMSVSRKFEIVVFKMKKFVVEQLKQKEYREDIFSKEILILEYLSIFSRKLLHNLKVKSHHQERMIEYCSLSNCGVFGVNYSVIQHPSKKYILSGKFPKAETAESDCENNQIDATPDIFIRNRGFSEDKKLSVLRRESIQLDKQQSESNQQMIFKSLTSSDIFKFHEGNFYSYLNVEDHKQIIAYINSEQCEEKEKQKIKKNIQDLCVNIPSIHKLLDELSISEEQCVQAELVLDELLKNVQNSQFLVAKSKLLFLKISLYVEKFITDSNLNQSIEDIIHRDEIENIYEEIDKKFTDFDKNEIFIEILEIEKQFIIFYLIYMSFKRNRENELSHTFEQILKVSKDVRFSGVKENLIPKLLSRIKELKEKEKKIQEDKKDIKINLNALNILESKIHLLNALIEQDFNTQFHLGFQELQESIKIFESSGLISLMIQTTMVFCKKKLSGLKQTRDTQNLIKLKKEMIDPAINLSKIWKLTSQEADCKKILGEINDQLHHISSNVFQFMRSAPLMLDKNTSYGHIIRLNQSFKRRITDILSRQGKELNLKFEIQTIKHFKECLQRGSKVNYSVQKQIKYSKFIIQFMCINCDEFEEDGIIVEEDQLPLLRKYKEIEMEEYYKMHYEEFGQIEILMLCTPNGIQLKEMFCRIIDTVNQTIQKNQNNPDKQQKHKSSSDKEIVAEDSELRRKPTIIAFQFNPNQKKVIKTNERRRTTVLIPKSQSGEESPQKNSKISDRIGKQDDIPEDIVQDEYEDFYLQYLKEFATQSFQFEFLTQLLQDKPDTNPQVHIRRAFNQAKTKMVEETIRICYENIKDQQSFEQILGKGPVLFLSNDWMDAKYDFRKGQIIDITSERPPQNLNRNFLRISGRKQDIYIILQKIIENSINIYGQIGIGKSIVAQQVIQTNQRFLINFKLVTTQYFNLIIGFLFQPYNYFISSIKKEYLLLKSPFLLENIILENKKIYFKRILYQNHILFLKYLNIFVIFLFILNQIAYFTFSRNTFSDGVYYFSLKQLPNFNYDLKNLMQSLLGLQFSQDVSEYFSSQKNMLLIFDDFDIIVNSIIQNDQQKVKYFEYIFYYINNFEIKYILVTQKSLRPILEQKDNQLSCIKQNMYYHEVKMFSKQEALNFQDSLFDLEQISIKNIHNNRKYFEKLYKKAQGNPKKLIELYCKKFGNPKIPSQFMSFSTQNHGTQYLSQSTSLNLSQYVQQMAPLQIPSNPYNSHNYLGYPQKNKKKLITQKSRDFGNQSQIPSMNMMQINSLNQQNYNVNYLPLSTKNSQVSNYNQGYSSSEKLQNQHQIYEQQFFVDQGFSNNHAIINQQLQQNYLNNQLMYNNNNLAPIPKHQSIIHSQYFQQNKLNRSSSQQIQFGGNQIDSSQSLVIYPQQQQQIGSGFTERKQGSMHQIQQQSHSIMGQIQKTSNSHYQLKPQEQFKHKSQKTFNTQHNLQLEIPNQSKQNNQQQHGVIQNANLFSPFSQKLQNNNNNDIQQKPFHSHHFSNPTIQNYLEQKNQSNANVNMTQSNSNNPSLFQQTSNQNQGQKKQLVHTQPIKKEGSFKRDLKQYPQNVRNTLDPNNLNQIVVQSDPELFKSNKVNDNLNTQQQQNRKISDYTINIHQSYSQFEQEDLYQNQDFNNEQYEITQEEQKMHQRAGSGNILGNKQQTQSQNLQNNNSNVNQAQDFMHHSMQNLNNSVNIGSANNVTLSSKKRGGQNRRAFKFTDINIKEEHSVGQSMADEEDMSNMNNTSNNYDELDIRLNNSQFLKELFGTTSYKTEDNNINLSNSQSLKQNNTKISSSNQQLRSGSQYFNDMNFTNNGVPFDYQVNNIEEEEEEYPKSDDEFINQLENQKLQENIQQQLKHTNTIVEDNQEYNVSHSTIAYPELKKKFKDQISHETIKGEKRKPSNAKKSNKSSISLNKEEQESNEEKEKIDERKDKKNQNYSKDDQQEHDEYQDGDEEEDYVDETDYINEDRNNYISDFLYGNQFQEINSNTDDKQNIISNFHNENKRKSLNKNFDKFSLVSPLNIPISLSQQHSQNFEQIALQNQSNPIYQQQIYLDQDQAIQELHGSIYCYPYQNPQPQYYQINNPNQIYTQYPQQSQQKKQRSQRFQSKDILIDRKMSQDSFSNQNSQKQFLDEQIKEKLKQSLQSLDLGTRSDSQTSKAAIQNIGNKTKNQNLDLKHAQSQDQNKNKNKKKLGEIGKSSSFYINRKKYKSNDYTNKIQESSYSEEYSDDTEE